MNKIRICGIALMLLPATAFGAETRSVASLSQGKHAAIAHARGQHTIAQGTTSRGLSHGLAFGSDGGGMSLSGSTAVGGRCRVAGGTINLTIGPQGSTASSGYGHAAGCYPSITIGGGSRPGVAAAAAHARGLYFHTDMRAMSPWSGR